MLPHEREMVERLKDEPFTLLGINSDKDRSVLRKVLKDENITWPNIYGGPTSDNPIARKWNVRGWPTIYILDHEGIIRHKNLRGEQMEEAVNELLEKVPGRKSNASKAARPTSDDDEEPDRQRERPAKDDG